MGLLYRAARLTDTLRVFIAECFDDSLDFRGVVFGDRPKCGRRGFEAYLEYVCFRKIQSMFFKRANRERNRSECERPLGTELCEEFAPSFACTDVATNLISTLKCLFDVQGYAHLDFLVNLDSTILVDHPDGTVCISYRVPISTATE